MEELKICVIIEHNGEKLSSGIDFSDVLNEGKELKADHVMMRLTDIIRTATRTLQRRKLVHPFEIVNEEEMT